ncbi:MAG: DegT/DnrJ/EryC1/StrS aminotransferase family protein [Deltaproteobacteria bacterium]|nr:DegT/DnrJ/EryC1/StrS aminotransferase family protein [Deltaproteobacteria bacterium]
MLNGIEIPVYRPFIQGNEKKYVNDCIDSTWISSKGKYVALFEEKFAERINVKYAAAVCNGTAALHLALVALGIGEGDEVIVPTLTYIACANAISYTGAVPVFVDSLKETWQMDPDDVQRKITSKTRGIMAVHLYGHPCEMEKLKSLADEYDLFLIEDCAEAFGSLYKGQHVGSFGHIAAYSFFGNKTITTGEGGMVVTNDETLYERAIHYRGQGLAKYREYWHDVLGYNYRMTNICAAIGLAQLEMANEILKRKRIISEWYKKELEDIPVEFHQEKEYVKHSYWMCSILVELTKDRDPLRGCLREEGIETRPIFYPIHTMPMYCLKFQRHPVAESIGWRGINLPSYPSLGVEEIERICSVIRRYYKR